MFDLRLHIVRPFLIWLLTIDLFDDPQADKKNPWTQQNLIKIKHFFIKMQSHKMAVLKL